ncbi:hypothetical protein CTI12_AA147590 [Artemisia annua]|uniref:KIB1-4 beta-propeller domain-containing protein n=1 Tax=Artemisia annua TaxID=35608 RepID=A0A2U1PJ23_ARTAN|nr:hypothetical protein CTI12_AA147590 [Artemisia annua]
MEQKGGSALPPLCAKYPWLVSQRFEGEDSEGDQIFFTIHDPLLHYKCRIPELSGNSIRGNFHGWVVLSNNTMWSLWNPLTSKMNRLPPLILEDGDCDISIKDCCLSSPPNDPESVLLLTRTNKSTFVFCRLDRKKWTEMSYAEQLKQLTRDGNLMEQKGGSALPPLCAKYPWLVSQRFEGEDSEGDQIFFTIHDPLLHYKCRIPELSGNSIRGNFHGWVVLSNNTMWSLWNPLTSKMNRLPPLILEDGDCDISIKDCCLSSPPNDPESVLLLTRTNKSTFVFCRLDRKKWTEMSYAEQLKQLTRDGNLVHSLACCNGKIYLLEERYSPTPKKLCARLYHNVCLRNVMAVFY